MSGPTEPSPAIVLKGVTKRFKKHTIRREYTTLKSELVDLLLRRKKSKDAGQAIEALRGINLTIPRGRTVGILGRNGSGKSTLLKLVTGIYTPTEGTIEVGGRISALLDLGAGFHPDFSGRENILINGIILGMSRADVRARMDEIIAFSELGDFIDEPVRTYSSGMYMRLAFAVATHVDPEILIIDEILAVGDEHFSRKSMARMSEFKRAGKTILLVTHDLNTVERWCDLAAWIDGGRIREFGTPADIVRHYREAVRLAEASDKPFVPPALAADGGALPSLEVAGGAACAPFTPRILDVQGREIGGTRADDQIRVEVRFHRADAERRVCLVEIRTMEEMLLFSTEQAVTADAPTASLVIDRVSLAHGVYRVVVRGRRNSGSFGEPQVLTLGVEAPAGVRGIVCPPHHWEAGNGNTQSPPPEPTPLRVGS